MKCSEIKKNSVVKGDSLKMGSCLADNSVDAVIIDPPYNISVDNWDTFESNKSYQEWVEKWGKEAERFLKPGGYLLSFSSPRLQHRLASGLENVGFKIKDTLEWIYATGIPKSFNMSKGFDNKPVQSDDVIKAKKYLIQKVAESGKSVAKIENELGFSFRGYLRLSDKSYDRWGRVFPKGEKWIKVKEVLGIEGETPYDQGIKTTNRLERPIIKKGEAGLGKQDRGFAFKDEYWETGNVSNDAKKWDGWGTSLKPAHETIIMAQKKLDRSTLINVKEWGVGGINIKDNKIKGKDGKNRYPTNVLLTDQLFDNYDKYFLIPKPSKKEKTHNNMVENDHLTVKPIELMDHLVNLVTPKGSLIVDLFAGSGTTLVSAKKNCRDYVGFDLDDEFVDIARKRLALTPRCNITEEKTS